MKISVFRVWDIRVDEYVEFDKIMFSPDGSVDLLVEGELWEDSDEQGGNVFIVERYTGVNDSENNPVFVPFANANLQKMK